MHRLARATRRFVPSINPLRAPHTPKLRLVAFVGSSRLSGPLERPAFASYFARPGPSASSRRSHSRARHGPGGARPPVAAIGLLESSARSKSTIAKSTSTPASDAMERPRASIDAAKTPTCAKHVIAKREGHRKAKAIWGAEVAKTHQRPYLSHLGEPWVGRTVWESDPSRVAYWSADAGDRASGERLVATSAAANKLRSSSPRGPARPTSFKSCASRLSCLTSSVVAARVVSPASRRLPASRNSFDQE